MCGWPPYIDVQVCRVDIKCNRGYVDGHHILQENLKYRDVIKTKEALSNSTSLSQSMVVLCI